MEETIGNFSRNYYIYGYDTDIFRLATVPRLLCMLHETAGEHVTELNIGWDSLHKMDQFWALSKISIEFARFPKWKERVTVHTRAMEKRLITYPRYYQMVDFSGETLLEALSDWVLMKGDGTLVRRNEAVDQRIGLTQNFPTAMRTTKIGSISANKEKIIYSGAVLSDLDMNDHVNNASYARWILDSYAHQFYIKNQMRRLNINYVSQLKGGETYYIVKEINSEGIHQFTIYTEIRGIICNLSIEWEPRK